MKKEYKNIEIIKEITQPEKELKDNQFYALMVTDEYNKDLQMRPKTDYYDYEKAYIGIECNSEHKIYISKEFNNRNDRNRGKTILINVFDKANTYELTY
jgi:hypothetical protein